MIEELAVADAHPPEAGIVLVTVYVPGVLAERSTSPVPELTNTNPAVEVKVPAVPPPLNAGNGSVPDWQ